MVASGNSYTIGTAGTITSWSFRTGSVSVPGLKLKVGRPQTTADTYRIIGEAAAGTQAPNAVNTYTTNIAVQSGDVVGIHAAPGPMPGAPCQVLTNQAGDQYAFAGGDALLNSTASGPDQGLRFPVSATVTTTTPDQPAAQPPSSAITLGKPHLNRRKGTAKLPVTVPGAGDLSLAGKGVARRTSQAPRAVGAAGTVKLLVMPKGRTKRKLDRTGRAKVRVTVTFTPTGGSPNRQGKTVRLVKKH
jgi:hypothetical protein